jgi:hypothetical protein
MRVGMLAQILLPENPLFKTRPVLWAEPG